MGLREAIEHGDYDAVFQSLYPGTPIMHTRDRWTQVVGGYASVFGENDKLSLFSAPGRIEIGGNHTDHQHGCVLAAAVSLDVIAAAAPNDTNKINIHSEGFLPYSIDLSELSTSADEYGESSALVRGIADQFYETVCPVSGFDAYIASDVPAGSGLSSSAAFEVLIGTIVNSMFNDGKSTPQEIARIGQYAENVFFGKPSGLMDQTASAVGGAVAIDFADPDNPLIERIAVGLDDYRICITATGGDHSDLTGEYASIPEEMSAVAEIFGEKWLRDVPPSHFFERLADVRATLGDRAALRGFHFFAENERAQAEADALKKNDTHAFLRLVAESGRSSLALLQNISIPGAVREQPMALALALSEKLLGSRGATRVHGGGFAGTILAFVPINALESYTAGMETITGKATCRVVSIRSAGGVCLAPIVTPEYQHPDN